MHATTQLHHNQVPISTVTFFEYIISADGISMDEDKLKAMGGDSSYN